jgi:hypothetical protein
MRAVSRRGRRGQERSELRYAVLLGDENPEPENRSRHRVLRFREDDCSSPELSGCLARNHRLESDQFNIGIHRPPFVQPLGSTSGCFRRVDAKTLPIASL